MGNLNLKNPFFNTNTIQQSINTAKPVQKPPIQPLMMTSSIRIQQPITIFQPDLTNMNIYNNPLQQYSIIVNTTALKNCMVNASNNLSILNQCVLSHIKGTNKLSDSTIQVVNFVSNNPIKSSELTTVLTQVDINSLLGTNLTIYNINTNNQFNNISVNLQGLQQSLFYGDINSALINNIHGYDSKSNKFINIILSGSNYTIDSSGNLISIPNFESFLNLENNIITYNTKIFIFIVCIMLYLVVMNK
jgi:hypothetical protein